VADLTIEDPPIEDVIELVFADAGPAVKGGRESETDAASEVAVG
jgi:hypothetical protein